MDNRVEFELMEQISPLFAEMLEKQYADVKGTMPEFMHGTLLINAAGNLMQNMVKAYPVFAIQMNSKMGEVDFTVEDYKSLLRFISQDALSAYGLSVYLDGLKDDES